MILGIHKTIQKILRVTLPRPAQEKDKKAAKIMFPDSIDNQDRVTVSRSRGQALTPLCLGYQELVGLHLFLHLPGNFSRKLNLNLLHIFYDTFLREGGEEERKEEEGSRERWGRKDKRKKGKRTKVKARFKKTNDCTLKSSGA